jgi:hypothetical protein
MVHMISIYKAVVFHIMVLVIVCFWGVSGCFYLFCIVFVCLFVLYCFCLFLFVLYYFCYGIYFMMLVVSSSTLVWVSNGCLYTM